MALLQNNLLGVDNEHLLNEIHESDNNQFDQDLYSQMQKKSDMCGLLDPERTPEHGNENGNNCAAF